MLHLHILSCIFSDYFIYRYILKHFKKSRRITIFQTVAHDFTLIYAVDVNFRILDINSVIYEWRGKSYVAYIENALCGVAVVGLMEVSIAKERDMNKVTKCFG